MCIMKNTFICFAPYDVIEISRSTFYRGSDVIALLARHFVNWRKLNNKSNDDGCATDTVVIVSSLILISFVCKRYVDYLSFGFTFPGSSPISPAFTDLNWLCSFYLQQCNKENNTYYQKYLHFRRNHDRGPAP